MANLQLVVCGREVVISHLGDQRHSSRTSQLQSATPYFSGGDRVIVCDTRVRQVCFPLSAGLRLQLPARQLLLLTVGLGSSSVARGQEGGLSRPSCFPGDLSGKRDLGSVSGGCLPGLCERGPGFVCSTTEQPWGHGATGAALLNGFWLLLWGHWHRGGVSRGSGPASWHPEQRIVQGARNWQAGQRFTRGKGNTARAEKRDLGSVSGGCLPGLCERGPGFVCSTTEQPWGHGATGAALLNGFWLLLWGHWHRGGVSRGSGPASWHPEQRIVQGARNWQAGQRFTRGKGNTARAEWVEL
ncbi:Hypothetical predicted protein [Marmota monax]|uniref:Uncharacterized protein n=1 Tax=Marmota monax TaxID=9995 RepID=A0A5E4BKX3_MARMO|nr:Hypothetical predicted protein [Marmota monax]